MVGFSPDFANALHTLDVAVTEEAQRRPFNMLVQEGFITKARVGGDYVAYINGHEHLAVADGGAGLDDSGFFHFSLEEDNPLG
jgi:hypothetical protein